MNKIIKRDTKYIRTSLKTSTIEGSWWAVMYGSVETYFGAFFEFLKYSSFEISILTTLPIFIGSIFQNYTSFFFHILKSRKTLLVILKIIQTLLLPTIYYVGIKTDNFYLFLLVICFYFMIAISQLSPWTSWMGYLVPGRIRGRYFANRSQIVKISMLISSLLAGTLLNEYSETDALLGFGIIFCIGIVANIGSMFFITKKYEPPYQLISSKSQFNNYGDEKSNIIKTFISFDAISQFSVSISGPLMMVFWIRHQEFNYLELAILINASQILSLFSLRYWGKKIDELGTHITIRWTSLIIIFFPIMWIGTSYLPTQLKLPMSIMIASFGALTFSGRSLAMDNRLFELMTGKDMISLTSKRIFYRGLFIFLGGVLGGFISKQESILHQLLTPAINPIHLVFLSSSLIRLSVWIVYLRHGKKAV
ncbi:MAG: hypothetical protein ACKVLE_00715 [Fidelibacterota bacterium]